LRQQHLLTWCPEYKSIFQRLWETDENFRLWQPFIDVTEEEERELLFLLCGDEESRKHESFMNNFNDSEICFQRLRKDVRELLKGSNLDLVRCIESRVLESFSSCEEGEEASPSTNASTLTPQYFEEIKANNENHLVLFLYSSRDRKIAHGICRFYNLLSHSETRKGKRVIVIRKSKKQQRCAVFPLPPLLLSQFLTFA